MPKIKSENQYLPSIKGRNSVIICQNLPICNPRTLVPNINSHSKISKGAMIMNRYNQVPHLTQDTNWKVINSQLDTTNESKRSADDHKAHINRHAQRHSKRKTEKKIHKRNTALERSVKYFTGGLKPVLQRTNLTLNSDVDQDT